MRKFSIDFFTALDLNVRWPVYSSMTVSRTLDGSLVGIKSIKFMYSPALAFTMTLRETRAPLVRATGASFVPAAQHGELQAVGSFLEVAGDGAASWRRVRCVRWWAAFTDGVDLAGCCDARRAETFIVSSLICLAISLIRGL